MFLLLLTNFNSPLVASFAMSGCGADFRIALP